MPSVIKCHSMPTGARQRIEPAGEILLCTGEPVENEEGALTRSGLGDRQFDAGLAAGETLLASTTRADLVSAASLLKGQALRGLQRYDEAATTMLSRVTRWSTIKNWGLRLARRSGTKKARVAIARKLAIVLLTMWRSQTPFRWSATEAASA